MFSVAKPTQPLTRRLTMPLAVPLDSPLAWRSGATPAYDPDAEALFATFTDLWWATSDADGHKGIFNDYIVAGKEHGWFPKLGTLNVFSNHDSQAARRDWRNAGSAALSGAPTFTPDRGYAGDGVATHLTGLAWNAIPNYALDNACAFAIVQQAGTTTNSQVGQNNASGVRHALNTKNAGGNALAQVNASGGASSANPGPRTGMIFGCTDAAGTQYVSLNAGPRTSGAKANPLVSSTLMSVGRAGATYNDDRIAIVGAGAYLTPAEESDLYYDSIACLAALGAYPF